ncbi:CwfJ C-terminus 1-domain-containing protein-like protein [Mucidula mucida]|nr:CwfJ C-terminus 1-domain-containing protein-like protein [Mucidula mucida]
MASSVKVLTVGPALGSIRDLFAKVKAIDAKHGKFDFVLCVGDFFGPPKIDDEGEDETELLLNGQIEAPLEFYIMQGKIPFPHSVIQKFARTGGEICKNVFMLSKSGLITTPNGLRIACLGGIYDPEVYSTSEAAPGFASPFFASQTTDRLLSNTLGSSNPKQNYKSLAAIQSGSSPSQLVDIMISNVWPAAIPMLSAVPLPLSPPEISAVCAPPLDDVMRRLQPRYHFSVGAGQSPIFWEREPYVWKDEMERVSRFVAVGAFGGPPPEGKKQRWFYAFSIAPNGPAAVPASKPANASKNPFTEAVHIPRKREMPEMDDSGQNFIFGNVQKPVKRARVDRGDKPPEGYKCKRCEGTDPGHLVRDCPTRHAVGDTGGKKPREGYVCRACGSESHYLDDCPVANVRPQGQRGGGGRRGPPKEITSDECWFCLSSPNLAKHLVVAIGSECYVTLPKGQIIPTQSAADHVDVPGGGHVLIVPIAHYPTLNTIAPDLAPPITEEIERYKTALRAMFAKHSMAAVFFEVGRLRQKGGHAHVQAVPIPLNLKDAVESTFVEEGGLLGIDFEERAEEALASCSNGRGSYFRVDLPDGGMMVHVLKDHVPFSIQFGRQVISTLLGTPNRHDWKECTLSEEEDRADAQAFKQAFAPFDPSS